MEIVLLSTRFLPGSQSVNFRSTVLYAVCLPSIHARTYTLTSGEIVRLPTGMKKAVLVETAPLSGEWSAIHCPNQNSYDRIRIFLCENSPVGRAGIRTSLDWEHTHWGSVMHEAQDVCLVACALPPGRLEYKHVTEKDSQFLWEPEPFDNKTITLGTESQVITTSWGQLSIIQNSEIPPFIRSVQIIVALPEDTVVSDGCEFVIANLMKEDGKTSLAKGLHIPLDFQPCYNAYHALVSVPGYIKKIKFSLAMIDELGTVTHLEHHRGFKEINVGADEILECDKFDDVRPRSYSSRKLSQQMLRYGSLNKYDVSYDIERIGQMPLESQSFKDSLKMKAKRSLSFGVKFPLSNPNTSTPMPAESPSTRNRRKKNVRHSFTLSPQSVTNLRSLTDDYCPKEPRQSKSITGAFGAGLATRIFN